MPSKCHIHTEPVAPRVRPIGKLGIVDWREDCSGCHNCVKRACIYQIHQDEADALRENVGYLDYIYQCKGCLSCIQDCTKNILTRVVTPEYEMLGDDFFKPDDILLTWFQAETGRIPVSGAGYGGPFSGDGFDAMWTDMSEIVRPTRDGIHGREYISTSVDIGRKLPHLAFRDGHLSVSPPPLIQSPLPIIFDVLPKKWHCGPIVESACRAASQIGLSSIIRRGEIPTDLSIEQDNIVPWLEDIDWYEGDGFSDAAMIMVDDRKGIDKVLDVLKDKNAGQIVAIRVQANPTVAERAVELTELGAAVLHLTFDKRGNEDATDNPRHMRHVLQDVHNALTKAGSRDLVTLIASGGIVLPEHVAKAIICGADLVAINLPIGVALECRLCGECERGLPCPVDIANIERNYAIRRITNLIGAWHQQLIELLGAMGIREVRRLRGEIGRSMSFEHLEEESFGRLFGKRKDQITIAKQN